MTDEPSNKRRRVSQYEPASENILPFLPTPATETPSTFGIDQLPMDPFLSPATSWGLDELANDPGYLATQEEFRSLLFNTARSSAPTRAGTPIEHSQGSGDATFNIKQVLSKGRRVQYLKNYIAQVAPWVSILRACFHGD
jgi:hypothetical protein